MLQKIEKHNIIIVLCYKSRKKST